MWFRICVFAILLTGLVAADTREDYDQLKDKIRSQRRLLNEAHSQKDYGNAAQLQKQIKNMLDEALEAGQKSPDVSEASLWSFRSSNLKDLGYSKEALVAVENYLKSPLLDRSGFRNGWRKKAQIYKMSGDYDRARRSYKRALTYVDMPRDEFGLRREIVNLGLRQADRKACDDQLVQMRDLLPKIEMDRQLKAEIDLTALSGRVYRQFGESKLARETKKREITLRKQLLERELENFEARYPLYENLAGF